MYWLAACMWYMVVAAHAQELHCPPGCVNVTRSDHMWINEYQFLVEGRPIKLHYMKQWLLLSCDGWPTLASPAMVTFKNLFTLRDVILTSCPLPDVPLITLFERLNITISKNNKSSLCLEGDIPPHTTITEKHFEGIEYLSGLCINASSSQDPAVIYKIINNFNNLTYLRISNMYVEVNLIPHSVSQLVIMYSSIAPLPQMLRGLRFLKTLTLFRVDINASLLLDTKDEDEDVVSNIDTLWVVDWKERHLSAMNYCNNLRKLHMGSREVESISENWITACTQLEMLEITKAKKLVSLPEKMLKRAPRLKEFSISYCNLKSIPSGLLDEAQALENLSIQNCKLQALPDGFLKGAVNLKKLCLSSNELITISSASFSGPGLNQIDVSFNKLDNRVVGVLSTQTSLLDLNLEGNDNLTLVCDEHNNSRLSHLQQLSKIRVTISMHYYRHLCSDLRNRTTLASRIG